MTAINYYRRQVLQQISFFGIYLGASGISYGATSYFLSGSLINLYLLTQSPIQRELLGIIKVNLISPELRFDEPRQRLILQSDLTISLDNSQLVQALMQCSSSFRYEVSSRKIFLKDPLIDQLRIEKIDDKVGLNHLILSQINPFLSGWINGLLVFEFNSKTQPIFKRTPSDIKIESEGIRFYFS